MTRIKVSLKPACFSQKSSSDSENRLCLSSKACGVKGGALVASADAKYLALQRALQGVNFSALPRKRGRSAIESVPLISTKSNL